MVKRGISDRLASAYNHRDTPSPATDNFGQQRVLAGISGWAILREKFQAIFRQIAPHRTLPITGLIPGRRLLPSSVAMSVPSAAGRKSADFPPTVFPGRVAEESSPIAASSKSGSVDAPMTWRPSNSKRLQPLTPSR